MIKHFPKKRFGQNFLNDPYYLSLITSSLNIKPEDHVVEIGPGQGALTQLIAPFVSHYDAVEIDRDLLPSLEEKFKSFSPFHLHAEDALKFNFQKIYQGKPLRIIGNLPYNISSPLLFHLLNYREIIYDMHFMLQLEVVNRLVAKPHTKDYGRLSVMTQYFCENNLLFTVPPGAFSPPPKVHSAFVRMVPHASLIPVKNMSVFTELVKEAFTHRD